jgi:transposase
MAKRQVQLSEQEIGQFREAEMRTCDVYELKRLQAIRLYGTGMPLVAIQEVTGAGENTIRQWAMAYRAEGLTGLRSKWQGKNASRLTAEQRQAHSAVCSAVSTRGFAPECQGILDSE